jgi:hypothetical protein
VIDKVESRVFLYGYRKNLTWIKELYLC